jgi:hypothetical protein
MRTKSRDALLRHVRSEHYKRLLMLMDLGSDPPLIEFHTVTETSGLNLIEKCAIPLKAGSGGRAAERILVLPQNG